MINCPKRYKPLIKAPTVNKGVKVWETKIPKETMKSCERCKGGKK